MIKEVKAEILTVGDELLYGQVLDTNARWLSQQLDQLGIRIVKRTTVGDDAADLTAAFRHAQASDIVLVTGGLGPTHDDITAATLAAFANQQLVFNESAYDDLCRVFASKGREVTEVNKRQAYLPEKSKKVKNRIGSAAGIWLEHEGTIFICMPGVPYEMKAIVTEEVIPLLKSTFQFPVIVHKIIRTIGTGETIISQLIAEWEKQLPPYIKLAYLPGLSQVRLRLTGFGEDKSALQQEIESQVKSLLPLIQDYVFGYDEDTIEAHIGQQLMAKNLTIGTAESCSGGFLAHLITSVPGSSRYFKGSVVSYANEVKMNQLGVSEETLKAHGAVSEPVVRTMAENVCQLLNTDVGLATSGVAGPDGGTDEKPVGTVWIACCIKGETFAKKLQLGTERANNIQLSAIYCLNLLRLSMLKIYKKSEIL